MRKRIGEKGRKSNKNTKYGKNWYIFSRRFCSGEGMIYKPKRWGKTFQVRGEAVFISDRISRWEEVMPYGKCTTEKENTHETSLAGCIIKENMMFVRVKT